MKKAFQGLKRGFTLIELIITIVIVGILAGIAIAGYAAVTESAEDQAAKSTLQSVDREYRAMDAFNKMGDRGSVAIADMTEAAELGVTFNDEDGNGRLDSNETVTVETSEKTFTLTLADATQAGDISTSTADDGSSESSAAYEGWDTAYDSQHNVTVRYLAERTGMQSFSVSVAYIGMEDPGSTLGGYIANSNEWASFNVIADANPGDDITDLPQIFVNEHGDTQWSYTATDVDFLWSGNWSEEPVALGEHGLLFQMFTGVYVNEGVLLTHGDLDTTIIIPAWNG